MSQFNPAINNSIVFTFAFVFVLTIICSGFITLGLWICRCIAVYGIGKRREIPHTWLSWVPGAEGWVYGSVADQYEYLVHGKNTFYRYWTPAVSIAAFLMRTLSCASLYMAFYWIGLMHSLNTIGTNPAFVSIIAAVSFALSVAGWVLSCICKYDIYRSCDPRNAAAFLIIGIVFPVTRPFFLLSCKNKDGGMPPRKPDCDRNNGYSGEASHVCDTEKTDPPDESRPLSEFRQSDEE